MADKLILIADDDPIFLDMMAQALRGAGYVVVQAKNGVDAIMKFLAYGCSLAVIDIVLPRELGTEVCGYIKSTSPQTPVILVTAGGSSVTDFDEAKREFHADAFMRKPFNPPLLLAEVERMLAHPPAAVSRDIGERRKNPRASVRRKITVDYDGQEIEAYCIDLSETGVFVCTERPLPRKTPVQVLLHPSPESEPFEIAGEVVHIVTTGRAAGQEAGMGIQFATVTKGSTHEFCRYVAELLAGRVPETTRLRLARRELAHQTPAQSNQRHALVVEDDVFFVTVLRDLLHGLSYEVTNVRSAESGLLELAGGRARFDLIIVDGLLPKMDGKEFCRLVRLHHDPTVPILAISGMLLQKKAQEDIVAAGATAFLPKPVNPVKFKELVAKVTARS